MQQKPKKKNDVLVSLPSTGLSSAAFCSCAVGGRLLAKDGGSTPWSAEWKACFGVVRVGLDGGGGGTCEGAKMGLDCIGGGAFGVGVWPCGVGGVACNVAGARLCDMEGVACDVEGVWLCVTGGVACDVVGPWL